MSAFETLGTFRQVLQAEGLPSALRRSTERLAEWWHLRRSLARGRWVSAQRIDLLNVCGLPVVPRLGGLPIQLRARLTEERRQRRVALFHPGLLEIDDCSWRVSGLEEAVARTGARWLHLEGSFGLDLAQVLSRLPVGIILSLHDLALLSEPAALRDALLARARTVIYPSAWLRSVYGVPGPVIECGGPPVSVGQSSPLRQRLAFVGSLKPNKGGALLPELVRHTPQAQWLVFGGGDRELLHALRRLPNVQVHGYYHVDQLPELLVRHQIGLAVLPSIIPESFGLTLSECWSAGVPALVFEHGAMAERIRQHAGGWAVPMAQGVTGMQQTLTRWLAGELQTVLPDRIPSAASAALAQLSAYRAIEGCQLDWHHSTGA